MAEVPGAIDRPDSLNFQSNFPQSDGVSSGLRDVLDLAPDDVRELLSLPVPGVSAIVDDSNVTLQFSSTVGRPVDMAQCGGSGLMAVHAQLHSMLGGDFPFSIDGLDGSYEAMMAALSTRGVCTVVAPSQDVKASVAQFLRGYDHVVREIGKRDDGLDVRPKKGDDQLMVEEMAEPIYLTSAQRDYFEALNRVLPYSVDLRLIFSSEMLDKVSDHFYYYLDETEDDDDQADKRCKIKYSVLERSNEQQRHLIPEHVDFVSTQEADIGNAPFSSLRPLIVGLLPSSIRLDDLYTRLSNGNPKALELLCSEDSSLKEQLESADVVTTSQLSSLRELWDLKDDEISLLARYLNGTAQDTPVLREFISRLFFDYADLAKETGRHIGESRGAVLAVGDDEVLDVATRELLTKAIEAPTSTQPFLLQSTDVPSLDQDHLQLKLSCLRHLLGVGWDDLIPDDPSLKEHYDAVVSSPWCSLNGSVEEGLSGLKSLLFQHAAISRKAWRRAPIEWQSVETKESKRPDYVPASVNRYRLRPSEEVESLRVMIQSITKRLWRMPLASHKRVSGLKNRWEEWKRFRKANQEAQAKVRERFEAALGGFSALNYEVVGSGTTGDSLQAHEAFIEWAMTGDHQVSEDGRFIYIDDGEGVLSIPVHPLPSKAGRVQNILKALIGKISLPDVEVDSTTSEVVIARFSPDGEHQASSKSIECTEIKPGFYVNPESPESGRVPFSSLREWGRSLLPFELRRLYYPVNHQAEINGVEFRSLQDRLRHYYPHEIEHLMREESFDETCFGQDQLAHVGILTREHLIESGIVELWDLERDEVDLALDFLNGFSSDSPEMEQFILKLVQQHQAVTKSLGREVQGAYGGLLVWDVHRSGVDLATQRVLKSIASEPLDGQPFIVMAVPYPDPEFGLGIEVMERKFVQTYDQFEQAVFDGVGEFNASLIELQRWAMVLAKHPDYVSSGHVLKRCMDQFWARAGIGFDEWLEMSLDACELGTALPVNGLFFGLSVFLEAFIFQGRKATEDGNREDAEFAFSLVSKMRRYMEFVIDESEGIDSQDSFAVRVLGEMNDAMTAFYSDYMLEANQLVLADGQIFSGPDVVNLWLEGYQRSVGPNELIQKRSPVSCYAQVVSAYLAHDYDEVLEIFRVMFTDGNLTYDMRFRHFLAEGGLDVTDGVQLPGFAPIMEGEKSVDMRIVLLAMEGAYRAAHGHKAGSPEREHYLAQYDRAASIFNLILTDQTRSFGKFRVHNGHLTQGHVALEFRGDMDGAAESYSKARAVLGGRSESRSQLLRLDHLEQEIYKNRFQQSKRSFQPFLDKGLEVPPSFVFRAYENILKSLALEQQVIAQAVEEGVEDSKLLEYRATMVEVMVEFLSFNAFCIDNGLVTTNQLRELNVQIGDSVMSIQEGQDAGILAAYVRHVFQEAEDLSATVYAAKPAYAQWYVEYLETHVNGLAKDVSEDSILFELAREWSRFSESLRVRTAEAEAEKAERVRLAELADAQKATEE